MSKISKYPLRVLLLAVWFGLLAGLGEMSILTIAKFFLNRYTHQGPQVVWTAPMADVLIFAIPGLILSFLVWRWPKFVSLGLAVFIFCFLGFLSALLRVTWLHGYASLLLAAGLAVQTARFITRHLKGFSLIVRRTMLFLIAIILGLSGGVHGWQMLHEKRATAKLSPAPSNAPNILLIVLDTVRAQNLSLYGYTRPTTPQLRRLAKNGVLFKRAVSTAPWTLPSHASMFTGRYSYELSASNATPLDSTHPTLAEVLSANGYLTAGFVANTWYCSKESGLSRGFTHYDDFSPSLGEIFLSSSLGRTISNCEWLRRTIGYYEEAGRRTAPDMINRFLHWLSHNDPRRPFFAFINFFDAHAPYLPPEPFDRLFGHKQLRKNARHSLVWNWSPSEIQADIDAYDGSIAYLDYHLGKLFDELENRGLLENTLVIITSDHGEEFKEHGVMDHGYSLYLQVLHVPLLIKFSESIPADMIVSEPISLRDLPATVIDLLKLKAKVQFPGSSLCRYWNGTQNLGKHRADTLLSEVKFIPHVPEWYPVFKGDMKSIIQNQYHYIKIGDGKEEIYNFEDDPFEKRNLVELGQGHQILGEFRTSFEKFLVDTRNKR
jgi:arylsulfatase A-like enzyme